MEKNSKKVNKGRLGAKKTLEAQENYTPYYAVEPLAKYINRDRINKIWLPFDQEWSAFAQTFIRLGFDVEISHIDEGKDFFKYESADCDAIISNPPYLLKDEVLNRLYALGKPFAMLLPLETLQGQKRYESLKQGLQLLAFDKRIGFHNQNSMDKTIEGTAFPTAYFCRDILPKDLIIEKLDKFQKPLVTA